MYLSVGQAAFFIGVSVTTLRRWDVEGILKPSHRTQGGHRRYDREQLRQVFFQVAPKTQSHAIAYARVSSHDQKADLETQKSKLEQYCRNRFSTFEVISDLGSGLNTRKPGLNQLLKRIQNRSLTHLVVNHKDRLLRFGTDIVFSFCKAQGIEVIILEDQPDMGFEYELSRDIIELMTVFSARLYGRRSHSNRKAMAA
jgi:predicted site-specific integrase-resolvase